MEDIHNKEGFLSRWAIGELSEEEKNTFEKTEDFPLYQSILTGVDSMELPEIDKDSMYEKFKKKLEDQPVKVKPLIPYWVYGIAASLLLLFSVTFIFKSSTTYDTGYGEQYTVTLPDNSEVTLNAMSKISYSKSDWKKGNRIVALEGEGFFKVEKGSDFIVTIEKGNVTVLGTQFTVANHPNSVDIICFEGKVKATIDGKSAIITKGKAIRYIEGAIENWDINSKNPSWIDGESSFKNAPIHQVIKALEDQYDIIINSKNIDPKIRFTGSFTHKNLNVALKTVFDTLEITFTFTDKRTLDITKK